MKFFDPSEQHRLEVGIGADGTEDPLPRPGDIRLIVVRPSERPADAVLPVDSPGNDRPALQAEPRRFDGLPDVDERMPDDEYLRPERPGGHRVGDAALLGSATRWSTSTPSLAPLPRRELRNDGGQVVNALQVLHDHSLHAKVVAPHLLHQLGVVPAFDEDADWPGRALHGP